MATATDAEIILKLYELRTEEKMRAARAFVAGFSPANFDEIATLQRAAGTDNNAYWRQVLSYWEMAAAFVLRGALDADLFGDCNGEPFFYYAKMTPYLAEWKQTFGQPFMPKTAALMEKYPAMQERYAMMVARIEAGKKQATR